MAEWKEAYKKALEKESTEELIKELNRLRDDLESMREDIESGNISSLQKSEFENVDIKNAEENIQIIESELSTRGLK